VYVPGKSEEAERAARAARTAAAAAAAVAEAATARAPPRQGGVIAKYTASPGPDAPPLRRLLSSPGPRVEGRFSGPPPRDVYSLPPPARAALFLGLCNLLLDSPAIEKEVREREAAGKVVVGPHKAPVVVVAPSGPGGGSDGDGAAGDGGPSLSPLASPPDVHTAGEMDLCAICCVGGNLLMCDGCPAVYHYRCVGESSRACASDDPWLCPECEAGGRAESAGLRVPLAGCDADGAIHWHMHGGAVRSARAWRPIPCTLRCCFASGALRRPWTATSDWCRAARLTSSARCGHSSLHCIWPAATTTWNPCRRMTRCDVMGPPPVPRSRPIVGATTPPWRKHCARFRFALRTVISPPS
jgi:hypothetical protein